MSVKCVENFGQEAIDKATKLLAGIDGGVEKAVKNAMPRAVSHLRANTVKAIQERYAISATNIRTNENVTVRYTYQDGVQAFINFAGQKIPLYRYDGAAPKTPSADTSKWVHAMISGKMRTVHPGLAASGHQFKSTSPTQYRNAFVAEMQSGHVGIFERTGGVTASGGDEIKELMGSSVSQMIGNEEIADALVDDAEKKFEERIDHEILQVLNGWGG